ncbi:RHS repeat-associated core domain-containing protein [bacterium]|nr:RHS repeat-associated core domain-containing protein [bacterium]
MNFTGKKCDPETGLYYFNQRYYDPKIGRFLTEDPAGQAFNPYFYASNNPLMYVDPDGKFFHLLIPIIFQALKVAVIEGAKAAVINAGTQLIFTGKINPDRVWRSFLTAGATAGIIGSGPFAPGGNTPWDYALASGLNSGLRNVVSNWAAGKSGNVVQQFSDGFVLGAACGVAKWGFRNMIGNKGRDEYSLKSGVGVAGQDGLPTKADAATPVMTGANNIGIDVGSAVPAGMEWFVEGGWVSE